MAEHLLFTYGTLQLEQVQLETFGRVLQSSEDQLIGFRLWQIEISDPDVIRKSGKQFHPIVTPTGSKTDVVKGKVILLSDEELESSDKYEVDDYKRVSAMTMKGEIVQVYIDATAPEPPKNGIWSVTN